MLASHADKLTEDGRQRLVRHGHLPEREVMTGIGPVAILLAARRNKVIDHSLFSHYFSAGLARRNVGTRPRANLGSFESLNVRMRWGAS